MKKFLLSLVLCLTYNTNMTSYALGSLAESRGNLQYEKVDNTVNFSGIYIGTSYIMSMQDMNLDLNIYGKHFGSFVTKDTAHMAGYVIGGGYQFKDTLKNLYIGAELSGFYAFNKSELVYTTTGKGYGIQIIQNADIILGYVATVTNNLAFMPYGSVGASFIGLASSNSNEAFGIVSVLRGIKLGGGIAMLYKNLMLRVGYEYTSFGKGNSHRVAGIDMGGVMKDLYTHNINATIGYKF